LRKISDGWSGNPPQQQQQSNASGGRSVPYKISDPGPKSIVIQPIHQRSHSDGDGPARVETSSAEEIRARNGSVITLVKSESPPEIVVVADNKMAPKLATLTRPKRPEEVECDQLSQDLISHLPPSDKLHALLSVPDPCHATACLVEGLFEMQLSETPAGPASVVSSSGQSSPPPIVSSPKSNSCAPLPATSAYFTTSEPKAKLLTRYVHNINNDSQTEPVNSEFLVKKKEELVSRFGRAPAGA
jgi:hypothetical protein